MDNKQSDLDPPPHPETDRQFANKTNVPPSYEPNVKLVDGIPVFSDSVMKANGKRKGGDVYDQIPAGIEERCLWQHCRNSHPHRHFWARDVYKYELEQIWGKVFKGIEEKCGWEACTNSDQKGHWHTFQQCKRPYVGGFWPLPLRYPTKQGLVLGFTSLPMMEGCRDIIKDMFHGKDKGTFLQELRACGWVV